MWCARVIGIIVVLAAFTEEVEVNNADCFSDNVGFAYVGTKAKTVGGKDCQSWSAQDPQEHPKIGNGDSQFPDGSVAAAKNYCRNPDYSGGGPWCYTTDPDTRWEYCGIEKCALPPPPESKCECGDELQALKASLTSDLKSYTESFCTSLVNEVKTELKNTIQQQQTTINNLKETVESNFNDLSTKVTDLTETVTTIDESVTNINLNMDTIQQNVSSCCGGGGSGSGGGEGTGGGTTPGEGGEEEEGCPLQAYISGLPNSRLTASSEYNAYHGPRSSRLYHTAGGLLAGSWSAKTNNKDQWIQVDLIKPTKITRISTQGQENEVEYVKSYYLSYSDDRQTWTELHKGGAPFTGNINNNGVVSHKLETPFTARYVRLHPVEWQGWVSVRWELFGPKCAECYNPSIINVHGDGLTASSIYNEYAKATNALLHRPKTGLEYGAWLAKTNDVNQWIQADAGEAKSIIAVATQGREADSANWVKTFTISYSNDTNTWTPVVDDDNNPREFIANIDKNTVVKNTLDNPFVARYVRLHPLTWQAHIAMRWQLYQPSGCELAACSKPGVSQQALVNNLRNDQLTSSSEKGTIYSPIFSRLYHVHMTGVTGSWAAKTSIPDEYLQAHFESLTKVDSVATQGRTDASQWVTQYTLMYSTDGTIWNVYTEGGVVRVFSGNNNQFVVIRHKLSNPITATYVRIVPKTWYGHISMRWELYGPACTECAQPGLVSQIEDSKLTASTDYSAQYNTKASRLHHVSEGGYLGGWLAKVNDVNQWIQADFGKEIDIAAVATQGRQNAGQWVTKYKLSYSTDGNSWVEYKEGLVWAYNEFTGNFDQHSVMKHVLLDPFKARYVRLHPLTWYGHIAMRWELYGPSGCEVKNACSKNGVSQKTYVNPVTEKALQTSSNNNDRLNGPMLSKLYETSGQSMHGSWIAKTNDGRQWIQVDLGSKRTISDVTTQGRRVTNQYVLSYYISYSDDGNKWSIFTEDGVLRLFRANYNNRGVSRNRLGKPLEARYVRVHPQHISGHTSMRFELFGPECEACAQPALIQNLPNDKLSASSEHAAQYEKRGSRLHQVYEHDYYGCWHAKTHDKNQWIQADLGSPTKIVAVATQGRDNYGQWVKAYYLSYSDDSNAWTTYQEVKKDYVFQGNSQQYTVIKNVIRYPFTARYVRLRPIAWQGAIAMRWELYGESGCEPAICQDVTKSPTPFIADLAAEKLSASTVYDTKTKAVHSKLYHVASSGVYYGSWITGDNTGDQYVQADLGEEKTIGAVATQGREEANQYTTRYWLSYSNDGQTWLMYEEDGVVRDFRGNDNKNGIHLNFLALPLKARYVRILPQTYVGYTVLRWELYAPGCDSCIPSAYLRGVQDNQLTASSQYNTVWTPAQSRLHNQKNSYGTEENCWLTGVNDLNQWLQIDLGSKKMVGGIATQGRENSAQWLKTYSLQYSTDGSTYHTFTPNGSTAGFQGNVNSNGVIQHWFSTPFEARYVRLQPKTWQSHQAVRWEVYAPKSENC